jgi:Haem-NO-binding
VKGLVFTEFLDLVETEFGLEIADSILENLKSETGGAYTTVGTYDHSELLQMVGSLSELTNIAVPDLVRTFGTHLFGRFAVVFPAYCDGADSTFQFLRIVEGLIHQEVRRLYPDAELPNLDCEVLSADSIAVEYRSSRPFADLAHGMILGCIAHYGETISVEREVVSDGGGATKFMLRMQP